ncbi:MAG TPA: hypothetical protein VGG34_00990 [Opitutaceae bacterium]|jgi:hypothetical protein
MRLISSRGWLGAALFLLCAACGLAAPSRDDALQAISVLEKDILGPGADEAAKTIVVYAQVSDDVMVDVGPDELPWLSEDWGLDKDREAQLHSLLLAAFVAGDVKTQLRSAHALDDTYSGWLFAIDAYHRMRLKENFRSPSLDALSKLQDDGKLFKHAKEVEEQQEEQQPPDTQERPYA